MLSLISLHADDNNITIFSEDNRSIEQSSYIDIYHGYLNDKVHEWGVDIDGAVLGSSK